MANTFDVHFQILPKSEQNGQLVFGFGFTSAVGVRGPQKLINKWLKCLLTPQGSDPFSPSYGTGFSNLIGSNIQSVADAIDAAILFIQDCNDQVRAAEKITATPVDERLQSATILKVVTLADDGFEIWVGITNGAGVQTPVVLPSTSTR